MSSEKSQEEKTSLHPRNRNRERYDLGALIKSNPKLKKLITPNRHGEDSIDFSNPVAVKTLNTALLNHYYGIKHWDFPERNLCPPIPGRADYIHHIADLLGEANGGIIPIGNKITCLDIGVGASCIYPIIGVTEYGWNFIASDVDSKSLQSANKIIEANSSLSDKIECRIQPNSKNIFHNVISKADKIDLSICNPPFHASAEEALRGTRRKVRNLSGKREQNPTRNFSGVSDELIYEEGEYGFISKMIEESKHYSKNCYWFSSLVSKQSNLKGIYMQLKSIGATQVKTIPMGTRNKSTRIVAWTFLEEIEGRGWSAGRWVD